ncbi:hypothetical protein BGZ83_000243 [Gryganskiella cystojenkinii]|nr:hypothetical protein BGZ83_000243 [Gryganskiella cystojenkinii]
MTISSFPPTPAPSVKLPEGRPKVLIVGAGLGGLTLGLLLQKAGIPFVILERTPAIKPLDFMDAGIVNSQVTMRDENGNLDYVMDFSPRWVLGGAELRIVSRPAIYEILYRKIRRSSILFNKRVLTIKHVEAGVQIACSDNSVYEADILVGADGTNSAVRQGIYRQLKEEGKLPTSDSTPLPYNCICLVGQTPPLDLELFPELNLDRCQFNSMCGVGKKFSTTLKDHDTFRSSESSWGPEAAATMCREVRDFTIPNGPPGSTLGTLIDLTPKELISKVALEEKVFKTWYSGRAVLIGDASHKLSPSGGVGATTAMHDALCLANWINVLSSTELAATDKIFQEYYLERYPIAIEAFKKSRLFSTINAKNATGTVARFVRRRMPEWLWLSILKKSSAQRPQASFLPRVDDKGTLPPAPQPSLIKTSKILASRALAVPANE